MKDVVIMAVIGIGATLMFSGCGSQTPKEQVYNMTYDGLSTGDQKVTPKKAKCIAENVVAKLSDENLDNLIKIKKLRDDGYEAEIGVSQNLNGTLYLYLQYLQSATYECL